jgi:hypothetical protein
LFHNTKKEHLRIPNFSKNRGIAISLSFIKKSIPMKKIMFLAIIAVSVVACKQKSESTTAIDPHQFGFNYDSTAQMDAIKATFKDLETYDTASYITKYADSAKFHDNGKLTNLKENVGLQVGFIAAGIKAKVKNDYVMWSSHFNFKDGNQGDYVYTYLTITLTKGDKSVDVIMFQANAFNKDGKVIEEWLVYDQSNMGSIMK